MDRPLTRPAPLPGQTRPEIGRPTPLPGNRPGLDVARPLPGVTRPSPGGITRPDWVNRPGLGNSVISTRPGWVNIDKSVNIAINNRWNNAFVRPVNNNWWTRPADRYGYWNGWANGMRHHWSHWGHYHDWYGASWWHRHPHALCPWHYHHRWGYYAPGYWWRRPVWTGLTAWFIWSASAPPIWRQPVYYDYGTGGNVTYQNGYVYVGGQQVASAGEFAQSAADLATVPPPATPAQAEAAEWMPLGTFAVTRSTEDVDPDWSVQLAVSKEGVVAGTLYNAATDSAQSVQGRVDKDTQRVAMRFGEGDKMIVETGLYNLTQEEAPVLVHYGADRVENWLLVRLENPDSEQ